MTQVFAPILTFVVYALIAKYKGGNSLDVNRIFTSLSLFALLSEPLSSLIMALVTFLGSVGCFGRIQEFLDKSVRQDTRLKLAETNRETPKDSKVAESVVTDQSVSSDPTVQSQLSLPFKDAFQTYAGQDVLVVNNGNFGWDQEKEPILKSINLSINREKLTMIVGPVGCGKSTLLKAFLGEIPSTGGKVEIATTNMAYCDQSPWHMNETIRQSIIAVLEFDQKWYNTVIRACALEDDLIQLPRGDQTRVGSKGVALSGGQSQRIVCNSYNQCG